MSTRRCAVTLWLLGLGLFASERAWGATVIDEFQGVRSAAMGGAQRAVAQSNDIIATNPAAMALTRRYAYEFQYGRKARDDTARYGFSAVDSTVGSLAGGFLFEHRGNGRQMDLDRFVVGLAYPLSDRIALGVSGRHVRGRYGLDGQEQQRLSLTSGDVGLALALDGGLTLGVAWQNAIQSDTPALTPRLWGFGMAYQAGSVVLAADMEIQTAEGDLPRQRRYHGGVEYLVTEYFPIRFGYSRAPYQTDSGQWEWDQEVGGGMGFLLRSGSLEFTYVRSLERSRSTTVMGALKFFI